MKGEQIFLEAVELQSLADRIAYLDRAVRGTRSCGPASRG